jgi:hypothetical protein
MNKRIIVVLTVVALLLAAAIPVFADAPNFGAAIYADDQTWGTKGTTDLPAPNEHNRQSFDGLYKFTNGVDGQLAVAEAAPGNPAYNGGRWIEIFVTWTVDENERVLVTSYEQLHGLIDSGAITSSGDSGSYFQCPLLPDKSS